MRSPVCDPSLSQFPFLFSKGIQDTTPSNKTDLLSFRDTFLGKSPAEGSACLPRYVPCCAVHPSVTSCLSVPLDRFITVSKWILPIYGALHFIPAFMFRRKAFAHHPVKEFAKTGLGSLRSSAFLGAFVVIYQGARVRFSFPFLLLLLIHPS